MYLICDGDGHIVRFTGVVVRGTTVNMYACFPEEQDALDLAFVLDDKGLLPAACRVVACDQFTIEEPKDGR